MGDPTAGKLEKKSQGTRRKYTGTASQAKDEKDDARVLSLEALRLRKLEEIPKPVARRSLWPAAAKPKTPEQTRARASSLALALAQALGQGCSRSRGGLSLSVAGSL